MRRTRVLEAFAEPAQRTWLTGAGRDYQDWSSRLDPRKRSTTIAARPSVEVQIPPSLDLGDAVGQEFTMRVENQAAMDAKSGSHCNMTMRCSRSRI